MKTVYSTIIETSQIFTQSDLSVVRLASLIPIHASENILVVICSRAVR
jgi:oligoribonuclease (3'-5' exoribonuclease)